MGKGGGSGIANDVCYSLPRLVTMAIQCSFCTYFWEMFTMEFGWTPPEYGVVSSLYSFTQIFTFVGFGILFKFFVETRATIKEKLEWSKYILMAGSAVHCLTYFLLIVLPISWYGFELPVWRNIRKFFIIKKEPPRRIWVPANAERYLPPSKLGPLLSDSIPDRPIDLDLVQLIVPVPEAESEPKGLKTVLRIIFSKKFIIYLLVIVHGAAVSAHELSNKALLTYMYSDFSKIGEAGCLNLSFFFISNIFIIVVFSFVKLNTRASGAISVTFFLLSIMYMLITGPILICFNWWTKNKDGSTFATEPEPWKAVCQCLKWLCLTIWHSTVVFLIFSCGPLINYVSIFIMGGHTGISTFGVLVFLCSLNGTSWLFMIIAKIAQGIGTDTMQLLIMGICILGQSAVYFLFNHCNYLILIATGIINSVFVTYTNIMLDGMVGGNSWKWIFCGGFYSGTNAAVAWAMPTMFNAFGQDQTRHAVFMGIKFTYQYCFPTIYRLIAIIFQTASIVSYYIYGIVYCYDREIDTQAKKRALPKQLLDAAEAFSRSAKDFHDEAAKVKTTKDVTQFQAAALTFKNLGYKFKEVGELFYQLVQNGNCTKLKGKANDFKTKVGLFSAVADGITRMTKGNVQAASQAFKSAIDYFKEAAAVFQAFAHALETACTSKAELVSLACNFKNAAYLFAVETVKFHHLSYQVGKGGDLGRIQNTFTSAAGKFGNGKGAAHEFNEAIKALVGKLVASR